MTQVNSAQARTGELALYPLSDARTLAQRRKDFAVQMRAMALSDLSQVSARLKSLHKELERVDGRNWTHYDLAEKMGIRPRTFQSWENGEVENRDGKGYDKMARFYSRKLGRKITRQWILFGEAESATEPVSELNGSSPDARLGRIEEELVKIRTEIANLATQLAAEREPTQIQRRRAR